MHNYTIIPNLRRKIFISIGTISVVISSILNGMISKFWGIGLFYIRSGLIALVLYFFINSFLWKLKLFRLIFKIPNLNGKYKVIGYNQDKDILWEGTIEIEQSLEEILIHLDGPTSNSDSQSASVKYLGRRGFELKYFYENIRPGQDCSELRPHTGNCTLVFDKDLNIAEGEYFTNVKDRKSFGTMKLIRITNGQEVSVCTQ